MLYFEREKAPPVVEHRTGPRAPPKEAPSMALASIAVPPDPKRDARARELVDSVPTWPLYTLNQPFGSFETGTVFRRAYGSNGARYLVNAVACECPDYAEWGRICKHIRAAVLWEARQAQPAPASRPTYADL